MDNIKSTAFTPLIFTYKKRHKVRAINDGEEIWFVAKDIFATLGISKTASQRILSSLQDYKKSKAGIQTNFGIQYMNLINRMGVGDLVITLDIEGILDFGRWILDEVLPVMEGFPFVDCVPEDTESDTQEQELETHVDKDKSKVRFAEALMAADVPFAVQDLATILELNGCDIGGQSGLFEWFREHGYLISAKGELYNRPTHTSIDMGLFIVKKNIDYKPDGATEITYTTLVTTEGMIHFINKFAEEAKQ